MKTTTSAPQLRYVTPILLAVTLIIALTVAGRAMAATTGAAIASQYTGWAGGKSNADALVNGMAAGTSITITTMSPDRTISIAGFTPRTAMSTGEIANALAGARASLARLGIHRPTAEQIQAALIGGELELRDGATTVVSGMVAVRGGTAPPGRIAATSR